MKCEYCGEENLENSSFCKECGKELKKENNKEQDTNNDNIQTKNNDVVLENPSTNNTVTFCCKCGQKLKSDWKICPNCKTPITIEIKNSTNETQNTNVKNGNSAIYVAITIISIVVSYLLDFPFGYLIALITIITGKIKCPTSKVINVLFLLIITLFIIYTIGMVYLVVVLGEMMRACVAVG